MTTRRVGILVSVLLVLGIATATAAPPSPTSSDLARSTIAVPIKGEAKEASDFLLQVVTYPAGAVRPWFNSPGATFATVKSGALTVYRGDATSCSSQTYSAGQGLFAPAGEARLVRNDGSTPAEIYVARIALPVGAAPRADAQNPGGTNCPGATSAPQSLPRTGGSDSRALAPTAGILIALGGVAVAFGRRRTIAHH